MKKILALILVVVMALGLFAGCESSDDNKDGYKVAMITDYGDIIDQSFNQTTYEACKAWCEPNGVEFKYYKPKDNTDADRVAMVDAAVADGYNVIVMPGFAFAYTVYACQDEYPEVKFIALDVNEFDVNSQFYKKDADGNVLDELIDENNKPHVSKNVYCAIYKEELSGYMAGYAAVKLGYKHLGFLGGMAVPAVIRFGHGFVQGADAAAVELGIANEVSIEYVYGGQFYGDADITAVMDTWYGSKGVEVVFACGGGIYNSAAEAAAKVNGKVIGVDVDQAGVIDGTYGEGMTVTSAAKGLSATVKHMLAETILNGNWDNYGGKIETLGLVSGDDPTLNYVELPMGSTQWSDSFTQDDYKALVKAMFEGTITVSDALDAIPASTITVEDHGNIK